MKTVEHYDIEQNNFFEINNFVNTNTDKNISKKEFLKIKDDLIKYLSEDISKSLLLKKQLISLMDEISKNDTLILEKAELFFDEKSIDVEDYSYIEHVGIIDKDDLFAINYTIK